MREGYEKFGYFSLLDKGRGPPSRGGIDTDGNGRAERSSGAQGSFLRVVQRSRQPFLAYPEGGRQDRSAPADTSRPGAARAGSADDSGLCAAGAGSVGTQL